MGTLRAQENIMIMKKMTTHMKVRKLLYTYMPIMLSIVFFRLLGII